MYRFTPTPPKKARARAGRLGRKVRKRVKRRRRKMTTTKIRRRTWGMTRR